jgi:hypothetical protein
MLNSKIIEDSEKLSRFILFSRWYRKESKNVNPEAFMPYKLELSVTRTKDLSDHGLMEIEKIIAKNRSATLYGNAIIKAVEVSTINLDAIPAPVEENPNHANVIGWPNEKSSQKMLAIEFASKAELHLYDQFILP